MRVTAADLKQLGVVDRIVPEPVGGAHRSPPEAIRLLGDAVSEELQSFAGATADDIRRERRAKFLAIG